jgi:chromosome segregation ATPase
MNNDLEGFGQWRRTVDSRLSTLETRVAEQASLRAKMDEDMSDLKVEFRTQRTLLQALHDTQQEHSATLSEHGAMLREHGAMLRGQGTMLSEQGATLREHGTTLSEHGTMLKEHGATLREHGTMLKEHGATLREHSTILREHSATLREHGTQLTALQTGQQRIMAGVDAIREMLDRTLNSGNE